MPYLHPMFKDNKQFVLLMAIFAVAAMICGKIHPLPQRDELTVGGRPVSRIGCLGAMNDLFGPSVDSSAACNCLLTGYYELVKSDSAELATFYEIGAHPLPGARNEQFQRLFVQCIRDHIVDTTYQLPPSHQMLEQVRQQLAERMRTLPGYSSGRADSVADCMVNRLDGRITVLQFIGISSLSDSAVEAWLRPCLGQ